MPLFRTILGVTCFLATSCQTKSYAPPPLKAHVESVEVEVLDFEGRPEAYAIVSGRLSTSVAQLVDTKQARDDRTLYLEVLEQTPRGATLLPDLTDSPPYRTRIPIELLGLEPGPCLLNTNGILTPFLIPNPKAVQVVQSNHGDMRPPVVTLLDQFVPIEETDSTF